MYRKLKIRLFLFVIICSTIITSCHRRFVVERTNTNQTHVKTLDAQIFNKTILENDLVVNKEVVLSDEDATGIVVRLQKDSTGKIKVKTFIPQRTVVIKNKQTNDQIKILPKRRFNKLRTFLEIGLLSLVILLIINYIRKTKI